MLLSFCGKRFSLLFLFYSHLVHLYRFNICFKLLIKNDNVKDVTHEMTDILYQSSHEINEYRHQTPNTKHQTPKRNQEKLIDGKGLFCSSKTVQVEDRNLNYHWISVICLPGEFNDCLGDWEILQKTWRLKRFAINQH